MSLIPSILDFHDPWELRRHTHRHRHHRDWDHFGLGITPNEIQALAEIPNILSNELKRRQLSPPSGETSAVVGKDGFQAHLDVKQFKPNEITVRTKDNQVVIEGKHDERIDEHGYISRHFIRKYTLPQGYNVHDVISTLSSDGVLTIKAPSPVDNSKERIVQIQQVGPAHLNVRGNVAVVSLDDKEETKK